MAFPIEFIDSNKNVITPYINLALNGAVVVVGGISVAAIAIAALKALGFFTLTTAVTLGAVPVLTALAGVGLVILGLGLTVAMLNTLRKPIFNP